jgi:hypothetical protein
VKEVRIEFFKSLFYATTIPLRFILVRGQSPTASELAIGSLPSRKKPPLRERRQKLTDTCYLPYAIELIKQHRSNINFFYFYILRSKILIS